MYGCLGSRRGVCFEESSKWYCEIVCGYLVDDGVGDSVELSCEGKEGGRMAMILMLAFEFFIVDTGEQPLDSFRNPSKNNR